MNYVYFLICPVYLIFDSISFIVFEFRSEGRGKRGDQWTEVLSWEPRAFVYHNFLVSDRFIND